jgi:hypothetical protein
MPESVSLGNWEVCGVNRWSEIARMAISGQRLRAQGRDRSRVRQKLLPRAIFPPGKHVRENERVAKQAVGKKIACANRRLARLQFLHRN